MIDLCTSWTAGYLSLCRARRQLCMKAGQPSTHGAVGWLAGVQVQLDYLLA